MKKDTIKEITDVLIKFVIILAIELTVVSLIGGWMYAFFPRQDQIGDNSIIKTCVDMGGAPEWNEWTGGCGEYECYLETCVIYN
jgi:hypothetical protein